MTWCAEVFTYACVKFGVSDFGKVFTRSRQCNWVISCIKAIINRADGITVRSCDRVIVVTVLLLIFFIGFLIFHSTLPRCIYIEPYN